MISSNMTPSAFDDFRGSYHYRPAGQRSMYDTSLEGPSRRDSVFSTSSSSTTMNRYLKEPDRPLFRTRAPEEEFAMHAWPGVVSNQYWIPETDVPYHSHRHPSPSSSLMSSSYSSRPSEQHGSPWSSPNISTCYSPQPYQDCLFTDFVGHNVGDSTRHPIDRPCIALNQVQKYADTAPEHVSFDDEPTSYGGYPQEGYYPMQIVNDEAVDSAYDGDDGTAVAEKVTHTLPSNGVEIAQGAEHSPVIRRRRTHSRTAPYAPSKITKITKRPSSGRRTSSFRVDQIDNADSHCTEASSRAFPCPLTLYGCNSSFGSKNEWKRHVNTQHLRLGFWRCDQCPSGERKPNDFNRKDLFIQHVRRMHPAACSAPTVVRRGSNSKSTKAEEDPALTSAAKRCYKSSRAPPANTACLFCSQVFAGTNTWDERMEHVGRHMEDAKKNGKDTVPASKWRQDKSMEAWLVNEGLVIKHGKVLILTDVKRHSA